MHFTSPGHPDERSEEGPPYNIQYQPLKGEIYNSIFENTN